MNKVWILACTLLLVSVAGFAATPSPAPLSATALAAILGEPADGGCAPQPSGVVLAAAQRPRLALEKALCTATAACESGSVSCQSNVSASNCSAFDRNCAVGERGHVVCDGVTTNCPTTCPTSCTTPCCRCEATGSCTACCRCDGGTLLQCSQLCNGG